MYLNLNQRIVLNAFYLMEKCRKTHLENLILPSFAISRKSFESHPRKSLSYEM